MNPKIVIKLIHEQVKTVNGEGHKRFSIGFFNVLCKEDASEQKLMKVHESW